MPDLPVEVVEVGDREWDDLPDDFQNYGERVAETCVHVGHLEIHEHGAPLAVVMDSGTYDPDVINYAYVHGLMAVVVNERIMLDTQPEKIEALLRSRYGN